MKGGNWHRITSSKHEIEIEWSPSCHCNFRVKLNGKWLYARTVKAPDLVSALFLAKQLTDWGLYGRLSCYVCIHNNNCDKKREV